MRLMTKFVTIAAVLLMLPAAAFAKPHHKRHPHHASHHRLVCRAGFEKRTEYRHERRHHRRVRVRVVVCVRKPKPKHKPSPQQTTTPPSPDGSTTTTPAPTIAYQAHVDPTFVQSPTNPLAVSFSYSASATATSGTTTVSLSTTGSLPLGVLQLDVQTAQGSGNEALACSMNVGGSVTGGTCPVVFPSSGNWTVTTTYIVSSTNSVSASETVDVLPYSTTTTLITSTTSSRTDYSIGVVDQNGNSVLPQGNATYTITDATTGQTIATVPDDGSGDVAFEVVVGDFNGRYESAIAEVGSGAAIAPIDPSDTFTITASYAPTFDNGWSASSSAPQALVFSTG